MVAISANIGVCLTPSIWDWYTYTRLGSNEYFSFSQTYSQNTGRTKKGTMHGLRKLTHLSNKLGIDFYHSQK